MSQIIKTCMKITRTLYNHHTGYNYKVAFIVCGTQEEIQGHLNYTAKDINNVDIKVEPLDEYGVKKCCNCNHYSFFFQKK